MRTYLSDDTSQSQSLERDTVTNFKDLKKYFG